MPNTPRDRLLLVGAVLIIVIAGALLYRSWKQGQPREVMHVDVPKGSNPKAVWMRTHGANGAAGQPGGADTQGGPGREGSPTPPPQ